LRGHVFGRPLSDGKLIHVSAPIRKTCIRYNDPGHAHYLTFSCFQQRPFLSRDRTRRWMIEAIALTREKHQLDLWAWVIMPEHVHLLICPRQPVYDISAIPSTLKQSVSKRAVLFVKNEAPQFARWMSGPRPDGGQSLRFWQRGGGYDRNLWSPKSIWEKINYIHANPVRRGLVSRPEDWMWSSYQDYSGTRETEWPLSIDRGSLPSMTS
jgi:putative transposase